MSTHTKIRDTTREAELVLLDLIRKKPASERLRDAFSASRRVAEQCKNAIRRRSPELSDDEVKLRFIELNYGKDLADNVRTWVMARRCP